MVLLVQHVILLLELIHVILVLLQLQLVVQMVISLVMELVLPTHVMEMLIFVLVLQKVYFVNKDGMQQQIIVLLVLNLQQLMD